MPAGFDGDGQYTARPRGMVVDLVRIDFTAAHPGPPSGGLSGTRVAAPRGSG